MIRFYETNEAGFITATADPKFPQTGWPQINFPDGFNFSEQMYYKVEAGNLVNRKDEYLASLPPKDLSPDERLTKLEHENQALREEIDLLTSGVTV